MKSSDQSEVDPGRRELLRTAARWAVGIGATTGIVRLILQSGNECSSTVACGRCGALGSCSLPPAIAHRMGLGGRDV